MDAVRLAVGTLSVLPAGLPSQVDRRVAGRAMLLAPLVGLIIGAAAAGVVALADWLRPDVPLLTGVLGILTVQVLCGGLHLDGLADTADGLGSRRDRATRLAIMRKGDVGPFGVAAIALLLLVDVAALTGCVTAGLGWQAVLVAGAASRATLPLACRSGVPAARPEGLGAMVAATVPRWAAFGVAIALTLAAGLLALPAGFGALAAGATGLVIAWSAVRVFGGITGDVLGTGVEIGCAVALLVIALAS
jgi:adenosylcobinamide-GDP ribazoletransferase